MARKRVKKKVTKKRSAAKAKKTAKKTVRTKPVREWLPQVEKAQELLLLLEHADDALQRRNFNLAEVWMAEYVKQIPQKIVDKYYTRHVFHALEERNAELLHAAIEAEQERMAVLKVKALRKKILLKVA